MAQYDGYVRIKTEITDDAALKKLQSLANNLNRQLMALEKQRGKVAELENGYKRLSEAATEFSDARKNGTSDDGTDAMKTQLDEMLRKFGVSKDQISLFYEQIAGGVPIEETNVFSSLRDGIESARLAEQGLEANVDNTRAAFEAERNAAGSIAPNIHSASSAVERFNKRIGRMAKTALIFYAFRRAFSFIRQSIVAMSGLSAVTSVFSDFNEKMKTAYTQNTELQAALASLRGALYTAFTPIMQTVVPMLVSLVNWLSRVISYIGAFFAALNGKKLSDNTAAAKKLATAVGGVGGAAKEANKQLAAFDKLNNLSDNSAAGGGGGGGGAEPVAFDTELDEGKTSKLVEIAGKVREAFEWLRITIKQLSDGWDDASLGEKIALFTAQLLILIPVVALLFGWPAAIIAAIIALSVFLYKNWDEIKEWWETNVTARIDKWGEKFREFIEKVREWWEENVTKRIDGWREKIRGFFDDVHTSADEARQKMDENAQKFKDKFTEVKDHIHDIIEKIKGFLKGDISFPHINLPHFTWSEEPVSGNFARLLGITAIPKLSVKWYADGGFPDVGSMFIAGEAGPELVGSFGGHNNSVINEAQLVQAFQSATAEQVTLLRQQNALLQGILEKSGVVSFSPSAAAGKVFSQSIGMYNMQMG